MLAEILNVLLGSVACFVNGLGALASSFSELLGLVLDLGVQTLEDGKNCALQLLRGLVMLIRDALGTC